MGKFSNKKEEILLKLSIDYKKQYKETPWWMFRKRYQLKRSWYSTRDAMVNLNKRK